MLNQRSGALGSAMQQAGRQPLSRADAAMLADGFPKQLRASVCCVCDRIPMRTYSNVGWAASVRERHIGALLGGEPPLWAIPYILKVCDEYVVEILELIYGRLAQRDTKWYRQLFSFNPRALLSGYNRMISYWNAYYRHRWSSYRQYVGFRLYRECFGYTDRSGRRAQNRT